jgi:Lrp/AsnC family transcriptional regulator, leucine-responsive regulatory protein
MHRDIMSDVSEQEPSEQDSAPDTPQAILEDHLDEHDYRIFKALNEDGRMSDTELANRVDLSRTAVRRRREKLKESGILEVLAVIVLQEANLAYADVRVQLDQSTKAKSRDGLIEKLIDAELVYSLDSCIGDHDLFVRTWHASLGAVKSYIWDLLDGESAVESYEITPVVKTWKAWDRELDRPSSE